MRPAPSWLPVADSPRWHNRQKWDGLGYIRVRTLTNPKWQQDLDWLINVVEVSRPADPGHERDAIDTTIRSAKRYRRLRRQGRDEEKDWDAVLEALDYYLWLVQQQHLRAVDAAGASGTKITDDLATDQAPKPLSDNP